MTTLSIRARSALPLSTVFLALGMLLSLIITPYVSAYRHLTRATALLSAGNAEQAIDQLRRSVSWRSPFNVSAESASYVLESIARESSQTDTAILAAQELWSGLQASRSWMVNSPRVWRGVQEHTAKTLLAEKTRVTTKKISELSPSRVSYLWQFLALLAFCVWIALVTLFIFLGFTPTGKFLSSARSYLTASAAVIAWSIWIFALGNS